VTDALPYKRLAGFYFFWFATLGALLPYWGLYMQDAGYAPAAIGSVFAILMGTKMVAPNVWGWIADHYGGRVRIIRLATVCALAVFLAVPCAEGFVLLALLMAGYGFFSNASLPQFEAVTFNHLGEREHEYGRIRLWGSLGFIVTVTVLGQALDHVGAEIVPWWIIVTLGGICLVSLGVPDPGDAPHDGGHARLWDVLKRPDVASLLAVCFLVQFSHGPYYSFFSIYMEQHGLSRGVIGLLWAIGVIAEIAAFAALAPLVARFGLRRLMLTALALTTVRWAMLASFPDRIAIVAVAQTLHLASFGLYHAVAVNLIHRMFKGRLQGRGQALYSSLSFGAGGAAGALASGFLWEAMPSYTIFWMSAMAGLAAWAIGVRGLRGAEIP